MTDTVSLIETTPPTPAETTQNPWLAAAKRLADDRKLALTHPAVESVLIDAEGKKLSAEDSKKATAAKVASLVTLWQKAGALAGVTVKKKLNADGSITFWAIDRIERKKGAEDAPVEDPTPAEAAAAADAAPTA